MMSRGSGLWWIITSNCLHFLQFLYIVVWNWMSGKIFCLQKILWQHTPSISLETFGGQSTGLLNMENGS